MFYVVPHILPVFGGDWANMWSGAPASYVASRQRRRGGLTVQTMVHTMSVNLVSWFMFSNRHLAANMYRARRYM